MVCPRSEEHVLVLGVRIITREKLGRIELKKLILHVECSPEVDGADGYVMIVMRKSEGRRLARLLVSRFEFVLE